MFSIVLSFKVPVFEKVKSVGLLTLSWFETVTGLLEIILDLEKLNE